MKNKGLSTLLSSNRNKFVSNWGEAKLAVQGQLQNKTDNQTLEECDIRHENFRLEELPDPINKQINHAGKFKQPGSRPRRNLSEAMLKSRAERGS